MTSAWGKIASTWLLVKDDNRCAVGFVICGVQKIVLCVCVAVLFSLGMNVLTRCVYGCESVEHRTCDWNMILLSFLSSFTVELNYREPRFDDDDDDEKGRRGGGLSKL